MLKYKIPQIVTLTPKNLLSHPNSGLTQENTKKTIFSDSLFCDRDRIQTCNRLIRSQLLYSVELRGHCLLFFRFNGCKDTDFF